MDPITPSTGVKHLDTSPSNCIPAFNGSKSVRHLFTACNWKWTECNLSGYINSTCFGKKIIQILSISKSRAENVYSFNKLNWWREITLRTLTMSWSNSRSQKTKVLVVTLEIRSQGSNGVWFSNFSPSNWTPAGNVVTSGVVYPEKLKSDLTKILHKWEKNRYKKNVSKYGRVIHHTGAQGWITSLHLFICINICQRQFEAAHPNLGSSQPTYLQASNGRNGDLIRRPFVPFTPLMTSSTLLTFIWPCRLIVMKKILTK